MGRHEGESRFELLTMWFRGKTIYLTLAAVAMIAVAGVLGWNALEPRVQLAAPVAAPRTAAPSPTPTAAVGSRDLDPTPLLTPVPEDPTPAPTVPAPRWTPVEDWTPAPSTTSAAPSVPDPAPGVPSEPDPVPDPDSTVAPSPDPVPDPEPTEPDPTLCDVVLVGIVCEVLP